MSRRNTIIDQLPGLIGEDMPGKSVDEIAEAIGFHSGSVGNLVRKLRLQEAKTLYVSGWRRAKGNHIALWKWGNLPDAEPLPNLTNAEACKRYRNTANGRRVHNRGSRRWYRQNNGAALRLTDRQNKKAIAAYERGGLAAIDPLLAAIMGVGR